MYFAQNAKMRKSTLPIFNFGIPAYKAADGRFTCPMAKDCVKGCYAQQGAYALPGVKAAYEKRYALTKSLDFVATLDAEIKKRGIRFIRVHDSGDFYSTAYAMRWLALARLNPRVKFYAYTKMVAMMKNAQASGLVPENFILIFSEGGKQDSMIQGSDRHSRVFPDLRALRRSGYANTTKNDARAIGRNPRIGLVYHGAKSRTWTTGRSE